MSDKIRNCYTQARQCINTDKSVRRLLDALASRGCHFDFERHLSCEIDPEHRRDIRGGFDRSTCQIVLFPENLRSPTELCTIFRHELIHAFDYCRVHIDFNRLDHLACTEIRASSLSNECSLGKYLANSSRPFLVKNQHAQCVQQRVQQSMGVICSNTPLKEINESIGRVFTRCYSDTDPFDEIGTGGQ